MRPKLTPELVLRAYATGIFPMGEPGTRRITWHTPDPRCIFELDRFHVPRSLRQAIRRGTFEVRFDTAFNDVIDACGQGRMEGTWISEEIKRVYRELHRMGYAHSVETWAPQPPGSPARLVGGLYGVALGGAFFGESMFHRATHASKVALVALVERLGERGFVLLDTQWSTPHLEMFGAIEIPRDEYLRRLEAALRLQCPFP